MWKQIVYKPLRGIRLPLDLKKRFLTMPPSAHSKRFLSLFFLLSLSLLFSSCAKPCAPYDVYGADEFVMDSYRIRQGKFAILEMEGEEVDALPTDALEEWEDGIHEDDLLAIALYHPTRKDLVQGIKAVNDTIGFQVKQGAIDIPDLARVEVAGLTLDQAREKIQHAFREEIDEIEVFLTYRDRLARRVDFTGLSALAYLPVDGKIRLYEALSKARVSCTSNFFMSYMLREDRPLAVDFHKLMVEGDMSQNIVLRGGDKIYIAHPNESKAYVMGEVLMPKVIFLPSGSMPLAEALVTVGGIPFTGDRRAIQVIRGNLPQPKIYQLSWNHIVHLPNDSLLLMPGDTVYVTEKPITKWNRFISQVLPSFTGLSSGYSAYKTLSSLGH